MPILTIKARVLCSDKAKAIILDAMQCATKVYNGLLWHLRHEYETTGKSKITRKNLNCILKELPKAKAYYSLSVQATRDEVIGAYESFFALRKAGRTQHKHPGFRNHQKYSPLRYFQGYGVKLQGKHLTLGLGQSRMDGIKSVQIRLQHRNDLPDYRLVNILLTYDTHFGLCAHLVVEIEPEAAPGHAQVAVDLGETHLLTALFSDSQGKLYSGRKIKAIRRYWQKVRSQVKPPPEGSPKSRRYKQIERKEHRQVEHQLHMITKDFVRQCHKKGICTIAIGDLTGIREKIDYGDSLNQRLHAWPFAKVTEMIRYKAAQYSIQLLPLDESYTSQTCHACNLVSKSNRKTRGQYHCGCGWQTHADVNAVANIFQRAFQVSPLRSSGCVAQPVVLSIRSNWQTVYEAASWQSVSPHSSARCSMAPSL